MTAARTKLNLGEILGISFAVLFLSTLIAFLVWYFAFRNPAKPSPQGSVGPNPKGSSIPVSDTSYLKFTNDTDGPIIVHLDVVKPPCGAPPGGACNPPDATGQCDESDKEAETANYELNECYVDVDSADFRNGNVNALWRALKGPTMSGTQFFVQKTDGTLEETEIIPSQQLEKGESWILYPPIAANGKSIWCYTGTFLSDPDDPDSELMKYPVCSGAGGWFTPAFTPDGKSLQDRLNAPIGVSRFEFNINSKETYPMWVLNQSAVDGLNAITTGKINGCSDDSDPSSVSFTCGIDLKNCPSDAIGQPNVSSEGVSYSYYSCLAPKLWGEANMGSKTTAPCVLAEDECWTGAPSADPELKAEYHAAWDFNGAQQKDGAKLWTDFLRPNLENPDSSDNCQTYAWAYDEQVCGDWPEYSVTNPYSYPLEADCSINDGTLIAPDNPFGPLGICKVYNEDGSYNYPNIEMTVRDIMTESP